MSVTSLRKAENMNAQGFIAKRIVLEMRDSIVTELAVEVFPSGRATLLETQNDVTVEKVVVATAELAISAELPGSTIPRGASGVDVPWMGETI